MRINKRLYWLFGILLSIILIAVAFFVWFSNLNFKVTPKASQKPNQNSELLVQENVLVGAGDIADCKSEGDEKTAKLLDKISGTVFTAGDNAYPNGSQKDFLNCFEPSWGKHKGRIYPSLGNHDYQTDSAKGYFSYFGKAAGQLEKGYYSYNLGNWHIAVLNSNCEAAGGCQKDSPQEKWLKEDLSKNSQKCALAYMHHPLFSSGLHGSQDSVRPLWQTLYENGVETVIAGHDHIYERFSPQNPQGDKDEKLGIREFVVGTGGASLYKIFNPIQNSEISNDETWGVLKLILKEKSYIWEFIPVEGKTFKDSGEDFCHF